MNEITITEMDYLRLNSIVEREGYASDAEFLRSEVEKARIVDFSDIPPDLITMNTTFRYQNLTDGKSDMITIVYPHHSNPGRKLISVLAPLGTALLGLRVNDEIDWSFPDGKIKRLKVLEILYQPEAHGHPQ